MNNNRFQDGFYIALQNTIQELEQQNISLLQDLVQVKSELNRVQAKYILKLEQENDDLCDELVGEFGIFTNMDEDKD
jgi:hypothetical protein